MTDNTERQSVEVDIACVGFGPAMGGFLTTLARELVDETGMPKLESKAMPGMPLQVMCYERADDLGFGVSGVATRGQAIRATFPDLDLSQVPMAAPIASEKLVYLFDPIGASRRPLDVKLMDAAMSVLGKKHCAAEFPFTPSFLNKHGGMLLGIGQFNQWVASQLMMTGLVQLWPGTPVAQALVENGQVQGVRLADQGVERNGDPTPAYMPGMDVKAALTVVGDGPVGAVGRQLDEALGMPEGHHKRHWAVGMKFVADLPEGCPLEPGTVIHTLGYPEPEIFGFFYVHPGNVASFGVFVPSFMENPVRTAYRYLQHWMQHPYIWRYLEGGSLRSWGAKSLDESGALGEPILVGDGFARIGEGSGSTNVLTGSGVDEAWSTGCMLAESVVELAKEGKPLDGENLEATYLRRRRASAVQKGGEVAKHSRDGFTRSFLAGMVGMGLAGFTGGALNVPGKPGGARRAPTIEEYFKGRVSAEEIARIRENCAKAGTSLHDALMDRCGWPKIEFDGKLLVSHQDALLMGGKVQAPAGFADHVEFVYPNLCEQCGEKVCIELCSAQAITPGPNGVPAFDREKCVHCGACVWNCTMRNPDDPEKGAIRFTAGAGGLHSAEN